MSRVAIAVILLALLGVAACGGDEDALAPDLPPRAAVLPPWAADDPEVARLLRDLGESSSEERRSEAVVKLSDMGSRAVEPLVRTLESSDDFMMLAHAAGTLWNLRDHLGEDHLRRMQAVADDPSTDPHIAGSVLTAIAGRMTDGELPSAPEPKDGK